MVERSRVAVLVGALVLATSSLAAAWPGSGAVAAGETCHGEAATIVGTPDGDIHGTNGPDVVVTNGAAQTDTGAGDDIVCVTGGDGLGNAFISVDEGDDLVDATASEARDVVADLGAGDDTFFGGSEVDIVNASDPFESDPGQGADTVSTGGGADFVQSGGSIAQPDHDTIDLGPGRDDADLEGLTDPALPVHGGPGRDGIELTRVAMRHALVIDNRTGEATDAGTPVISWGGMEVFSLSNIGSWGPPSFIGGPGAERVYSLVPLTSVDLGGGDDRLNLELQHSVVDHPTYRGGSGHDSFILYAGAGDEAQRERLDLVHGRLFFRRTAKASMHARIHGFEQAKLSSYHLNVIGSAKADDIVWLGCRGVVAGGRGNDLISAYADDDAGCGYLGGDAKLVVRGGPGDDRLIGNYFPDTLLGGPGKDYADGGGNKDRCVAEKTVRCES
ncbi:MAG: hypothetical protein QM747_21115 [Nocardioides sp.]